VVSSSLQEIAVGTVLKSALSLAALAIAAPVHASAPPDIDFEWYASVGRSVPRTYAFPAPRAGHIWSPGHWETRGTRQTFVPGHWIVDDYAAQVAIHNPGPHAVIVKDPRGELIVTAPASYPAPTQ